MNIFKKTQNPKPQNSSYNLTSKTKQPNWNTGRTEYLPREDIQMAKRPSTLLIIRKMQIKTTIEILPHTCQNGYHQKYHKEHMLMRMWRKGNTCTLLVGMLISAVTVEYNMEVPQEVKNRTIVWTSNSTPGYLSEKNKNTNSTRYMHLNVHSSIICNSQDMKAT